MHQVAQRQWERCIMIVRVMLTSIMRVMKMMIIKMPEIPPWPVPSLLRPAQSEHGAPSNPE